MYPNPVSSGIGGGDVCISPTKKRPLIFAFTKMHPFSIPSVGVELDLMKGSKRVTSSCSFFNSRLVEGNGITLVFFQTWSILTW